MSKVLYFCGNINENGSYCQIAIQDLYKLQDSVLILEDEELNIEIINCLVVMHRKLSRFENKKENLEKAIEFYERALKIVVPNSEDCGLILNNLGLAYFELAEVHEKEENLKKVISTYRESLQYLTQKNVNTINKIKKYIQEIERILVELT